MTPGEILSCHSRAGGHPVGCGLSVSHRRLGLLDRPVKPGDDSCDGATEPAHNRHCERSEAIQSQKESLYCFAALLAMTECEDGASQNTTESSRAPRTRLSKKMSPARRG